jgi:hypothetical protein
VFRCVYSCNGDIGWVGYSVFAPRIHIRSQGTEKVEPSGAFFGRPGRARCGRDDRRPPSPGFRSLWRVPWQSSPSRPEAESSSDVWFETSPASASSHQLSQTDRVRTWHFLLSCDHSFLLSSFSSSARLLCFSDCWSVIFPIFSVDW